MLETLQGKQHSILDWRVNLGFQAGIQQFVTKSIRIERTVKFYLESLKKKL